MKMAGLDQRYLKVCSAEVINYKISLSLSLTQLSSVTSLSVYLHHLSAELLG